MSASVNDKLTDVRNAARPNSTTVSSPRSAGGSTLSCASLAGWPTASKVHFVTYKIDSSSVPVAGTQLDCYGIVSGNSITSFTVVDGTDTGHSTGDIVEMLPTAAWGQGLSDWGMTEHTRTGTHGGITATSISNAGTLTQTGAATLAGALAVSGAISGAGYSMATITNPYKFSATQTGAANTGNATFATIAWDTERFDTNNNLLAGVYTVPVAGFYQFSWGVQAQTPGSGTVIASLYKGATEIARGSRPTTAGATLLGSTGSILYQLSAGDIITVKAYSDSTAALDVGLPGFNYFSGFLVSAT